MDKFIHPADRITEDHVKQMAAAYDHFFGTPQIITEEKEEKEEKKDDKKDEGGEDKKENPFKKSDKKDDKKKDDKEDKKDESDDEGEEEGGEEKAKDPDAENKKKKVKESKFETHVICGRCGSHDQTLSPKRTKIKCDDCGNIDLVENIVGAK